MAEIGRGRMDDGVVVEDRVRDCEERRDGAIARSSSRMGVKNLDCSIVGGLGVDTVRFEVFRAKEISQWIKESGWIESRRCLRPFFSP